MIVNAKIAVVTGEIFSDTGVELDWNSHSSANRNTIAF